MNRIDESKMVRRSWRKITTVATLLSAVTCVAVILGSMAMDPSSSVWLGLGAGVVALIYYLWATGGREFLSLGLTIVPVLAALGMTSAARDETAVAWGLAGVATMWVAVTTLLAVWVVNKWGRGRLGDVGDFFGDPGF